MGVLVGCYVTDQTMTCGTAITDFCGNRLRARGGVTIEHWSGGHWWDYYPGTRQYRQSFANYLMIEHQMKYTGIRSSNELQRLGLNVGQHTIDPSNALNPVRSENKPTIKKSDQWKSILLLKRHFWIYSLNHPRQQSSWDQHWAHLGPVGPIWAQCWPHEPCYQGSYMLMILLRAVLLHRQYWWMPGIYLPISLLLYLHESHVWEITMTAVGVIRKTAKREDC